MVVMDALPYSFPTDYHPRALPQEFERQFTVCLPETAADYETLPFGMRKASMTTELGAEPPAARGWQGRIGISREVGAKDDHRQGFIFVWRTQF
jgi:hypothetical protein